MPASPPDRRRAWPPWRENRRVALVAGALLAAAGAALVAAARGGGREDVAAVARLAAMAAWVAALMVALRRPPRVRARREGGVAVLRASPLRRFSFVLVAAPLGAALLWRAWRDGAASGPALGVAGVAGAGLLLVLALRGERRFLLHDAGLELSLPGGGRTLLPFERIREVRLERFRSHAGLVLLGEDGAPSVGLSAWLDGVPELAAALLDRAPPAALAAPQVREDLRALAGPLAR